MDSSIAFHVAKVAQEEGAEVVLTSFGRTMKITQTISRRLPDDAARRRARRDRRGAPRHPRRAAQGARRRARRRPPLDRLRPAGRLRVHEGPGTTSPSAMRASAYSLKALAVAALPLMERRQHRRAHLRREVRLAGLRLDGRGQGGVRVDEPLPRPRPRPQERPRATSSRPARSGPPPPSRSPASTRFEQVWGERAPLGWDINDPVPAAKACAALLSDWFPATTGEIVHVDGGVHAMGQ